MTFDEFITKWTGQTVDTDGIYPNQCMDLMHQYIYDVLGLTDAMLLAAAWAALVYTNFKPEWATYFDKIDNTPDGVPQKGDIVFFGAPYSYDAAKQVYYGHVCIFVSGDTKGFTSFDSNWPTGHLPQKVTHDYIGVLGWLHFKGVANDTISVLKSDFENLRKKADILDELDRAGYGSLTLVEAKINQLNADVDSKQLTIDNLNKLVGERNGTISEQTSQISTLNSRVLELEKHVQTAEAQIADAEQVKKERDLLIEQRDQWSASEKTYLRTIAQLKADNEEFKKNALKALWDSFIGRFRRG